LYAQATWNGVNVATASTMSSGFQIQFNQAVNILYNWSTTSFPVGVSYTISDARLQIFYFGFALATRDVTEANAVPSTQGNIAMNWSTGPLQYILAGTYLLVASLLEPSGKTVWSQVFWVDVSAPAYILAALPIVLILIAIYELYGVATVGRQAALKRQAKGGGGAASPASSSPTNPPTAESSSTVDSSGTPPPGGAA
jgi:hypothetical protein